MSSFPGERQIDAGAAAPYPHDQRTAEIGPLRVPRPAGPRPPTPLPDPRDWSFELIEQ